MAYSLRRLAPGSYDVLLDGEPVAALMRTDRSDASRFSWFAELLCDGPASERPAPFVEPEHTFDTLAAACAWLGVRPPT